MKLAGVAILCLTLGMTLSACGGGRAAGGGTAGGTLPSGEGGIYKVGNPYYIDGVRYVPREDKRYDETGIASWYGPKFHGKLTANGETYDMYKVSAAHKTLPMPIMVRVTNLDNGKSLVARLNDRGPYARGRIIDMSYRAAQLLDFVERGTARVRVEYVGPAASGGGQAQVEQVAATPVVEQRQPVASLIFVQAGSFSDANNARRLRSDLARIGPASVSTANVNGRTFHRVRLGPYYAVDDADAALAQVVRAGHNGARILVENAR